MRYRVVLHESKEGFAVACPGLPGCWSQGATEVEALDNIRSAIEEHLGAVATLTAGSEVREVEVAVSAPLPSHDPAAYGPLYREFAAEDSELAEQGMSDYVAGLLAEDRD
jgi:predicted RNase H-like HicB family nuclease